MTSGLELAALVDVRTALGLRQLVIDQDDRHVVFLGHQPHDLVLAAVRSLHIDWGQVPGRVAPEDVSHTHARLVPACPAHANAGDACTYCADLSARSWWLDYRIPSAAATDPPRRDDLVAASVTDPCNDT